jgi:hypothetical protein
VQEREGNKIKASIDTFTLATKVAQKDFGLLGETWQRRASSSRRSETERVHGATWQPGRAPWPGTFACG